MTDADRTLMMLQAQRDALIGSLNKFVEDVETFQADLAACRVTLETLVARVDKLEDDI